MTRRKAGLKALRVTQRRTERNEQVKHGVREAIRTTRKAVASGDASAAKDSLKKLFSKLDRAVKSKVIHKATATRYKARLSKAVNKVGKKS